MLIASSSSPPCFVRREKTPRDQINCQVLFASWDCPITSTHFSSFIFPLRILKTQRKNTQLADKSIPSPLVRASLGYPRKPSGGGGRRKARLCSRARCGAQRKAEAKVRTHSELESRCLSAAPSSHRCGGAAGAPDPARWFNQSTSLSGGRGSGWALPARAAAPWPGGGAEPRAARGTGKPRLRRYRGWPGLAGLPSTTGSGAKPSLPCRRSRRAPRLDEPQGRCSGRGDNAGARRDTRPGTGRPSADGRAGPGRSSRPTGQPRPPHSRAARAVTAAAGESQPLVAVPVMPRRLQLPPAPAAPPPLTLCGAEAPPPARPAPPRHCPAGPARDPGPASPRGPRQSHPAPARWRSSLRAARSGLARPSGGPRAADIVAGFCTPAVWFLVPATTVCYWH